MKNTPKDEPVSPAARRARLLGFEAGKRFDEFGTLGQQDRFNEIDMEQLIDKAGDSAYSLGELVAFAIDPTIEDDTTCAQSLWEELGGTKAWKMSSDIDFLIGFRDGFYAKYEAKGSNEGGEADQG